MALFAVAFPVVYFTLDYVTPTPTLPSLVFTKCNITKMCNINFDADRKKNNTLGTESEGQQQRTFYWDRRGVVLSFLSRIVIFIF